MGVMITIRGFQRQRGTSGQMKNLRASGLIPAVCYGHGGDGVTISLSEHEARQQLGRRNGNTLVQLAIEGEDNPRLVLLKEIQRNPLTNSMVHIDFQAINLGDTIDAQIPIMLQGEGAIAKRGWTISHQLREVEVECLPGFLPESFKVEMGHLQVGDKLFARDIEMPEHVKLTTDPNAVVLVVMPPGKAEAPPAVEGEAQV